MLTAILLALKALGAPLPLWVAVLPALIDLGLVVLLLLLFILACFVYGGRGSYRHRG